MLFRPGRGVALGAHPGGLRRGGGDRAADGALAPPGRAGAARGAARGGRSPRTSELHAGRGTSIPDQDEHAGGRDGATVVQMGTASTSMLGSAGCAWGTRRAGRLDGHDGAAGGDLGLRGVEGAPGADRGGGPAARWTRWPRRTWPPPPKTDAKRHTGRQRPPGPPHECRHSFASIAIAAGANIGTVSAALGLAGVTITWDRYHHLLPGTLDQAGDLIEPSDADARHRRDPARGPHASAPRHRRCRAADEDPREVPAGAGERGVLDAARAHLRQDVPAHVRGGAGAGPASALVEEYRGAPREARGRSSRVQPFAPPHEGAPRTAGAPAAAAAAGAAWRPAPAGAGGGGALGRGRRSASAATGTRAARPPTTVATRDRSRAEREPDRDRGDAAASAGARGRAGRAESRPPTCAWTAARGPRCAFEGTLDAGADVPRAPDHAGRRREDRRAAAASNGRTGGRSRPVRRRWASRFTAGIAARAAARPDARARDGRMSARAGHRRDRHRGADRADQRPQRALAGRPPARARAWSWRTSRSAGDRAEDMEAQLRFLADRGRGPGRHERRARARRPTT